MDSSEDLLSSSSLSSEYTNIQEQNVDFSKLVPISADMTQYYDSAGETNGIEYMTCKKCQEAHARGDISRVMKIKNKSENLRKHLRSCKFFCAEYGLEASAKPQRSKPTSVLLKNGDENGQPYKFADAPEGCKTMQVKYSRRVEVFDVTPGMTAAQIVKDLKVVFGVDDEDICYLRRESDKKVLLGVVEVCKVVQSGEVYKLESVK